jgi:hypothetical protein
MAATKETKGAQYLQIRVENEITQSPVTRVRWCVSPSTLSYLDRESANNVHILLVSRNVESRTEHRYLVPLDHMFHDVEFHRQGTNKIFATIVWGNYFKMCDRFLKKSRHSYYHTIFSYSGDLHVRDIWAESLGNTSVDVVLQEGFFAKEPANWEKSWVNLWFGREMPDDQCGFRRRRIVAYTIQPPLVLLWLVFKIPFCFLAALTMLSIGSKSVDFRPVIHPWQYSIEDVWEDVNGGKWFCNSIFTWPFKPLVLIATLTIGWLVSGQGLTSWKMVLYSLLVLAGIYVASLIVVGIIVLIYSAIVKIGDSKSKKEKPEPTYTQDLDYLLCKYVPETGALVVPKERCTTYIRFLDLKAKVCKVFPK